MANNINVWQTQPDNGLLGNRTEDEAYVLANRGQAYAVHFTSSGSVTLDVSDVNNNSFSVLWINVEEGGSYEENASGSSEITLTTSSDRQWIAVVKPGEANTGDNDRDGDGVPDNIDACPDDPGGGTEDGCPEGDPDPDGDPSPTENCNLYDSSQAVPSNFGAAYDLFGGSGLVLSVDDCAASGTTRAISAGDGQDTTYIYDEGYEWTGSSWSQFSYSCSDRVQSNGQNTKWCRGDASASINSNNTFFVGWLCHRDTTANEWNCGCRDTSAQVAIGTYSEIAKVMLR